MRKTLLALLAIGLSVAVVTPMAGAAEPPKTVTINCTGKAKKEVKDFKHEEHGKRAENPPKGVEGKGCQICHHKNEKGKEESCCKCHKEKKEGDAPAFKDAFHKRCQESCHKAGGKGPTKKCEECHGKA